MDKQIAQIIANALKNIPQYEWDEVLENTIAPAIRSEIGRHIVGEWTTDDVLDKAPWLTDEEALDLLSGIAQHYDCSIGLDWESFEEFVSEYCSDNFAWFKEGNIRGLELRLDGYLVCQGYTPLPNRRNTYVAYFGGLPPEEQDEQIGFIVHALEQFGKL